eukprot:sb/3469986/
MSFVSWFSNVGSVTSLLQSLSSPGTEFFWWSYYVTKMECAPQITTGFFQELTEVGYVSCDSGMFQVREIRAIKQRLVEASKNFELEEETEEEITEAVLFRTKLSHFFLSLSLWVDETRLQEANLFLPGLPAQYCSDKLEEIFRNESCPWYDMVDICQLDLNIHNDIDEWGSKNMVEAAPPPELIIPQSQIPELPELSGDPTDLLSTVGKKRDGAC